MVCSEEPCKFHVRVWVMLFVAMEQALGVSQWGLRCILGETEKKKKKRHDQ